MSIDPNPITRLDRPLSELEADLRALVARQRALRLAEGGAAETRHLIDPADSLFAQMACAHPEACSCDADYPDWRPGGAA